MKPRPWDETHPSNWFRDSPEVHINLLADRVKRIEEVLKDRFGDDVLVRVPSQKPPTSAKKRGPAPKLSRDELFYGRERIIDFLEFYWPELRPEFAKKDTDSLVLELTRLSQSTNSSMNPTAVLVLERLKPLVEFLRTPEWNGDPRIAAGAIAGVPKITWTTSLRKCRNISTNRAIGVRALRDYLRRNFPNTFRTIVNLSNVEEIRAVMRQVRTTDREFNWLKDNPEDVLTVMRIGRPGVFR